MRRFGLLFLTAFIILLMAVTNPSKQNYIDWGKEQAARGYSGVFEKSIASAVSGTVLENNTVTKNFIIFTMFETSISGDTYKTLGLFRNCIPLFTQDKVLLIVGSSFAAALAALLIMSFFTVFYYREEDTDDGEESELLSDSK